MVEDLALESILGVGEPRCCVLAGYFNRQKPRNTVMAMLKENYDMTRGPTFSLYFRNSYRLPHHVLRIRLFQVRQHVDLGRKYGTSGR